MMIFCSRSFRSLQGLVAIGRHALPAASCMVRTSSLRHVLVALLGTLVLLASALPAFGQSEGERASTEQRLRELQNQIQQEQSLLSEAEQAEQASMDRLRNLEREIALRSELTTNYERRLVQLNTEGQELEQAMADLEGDLSELRGEYQDRAAHAYKYGRLHDLALILAAESINQMLIRARYLHRFAEARRSKLGAIQTANADLVDRQAKLDSTRSQIQQLLVAAEDEQDNLQQLQRERQRVIRELRSQRRTLQASIQEKRVAATELESRLERIAAAARAGASANTAAYAALSGSFRQNKGRLPWPTGGVVTEPFGDRIHPVYGTRTPNPGLFIAAEPSAEVRAVFEGEVIEVSVLPDFGRYMVVAHGEYLTVYSNFSLIYATVGDQVEAGEVLGRAGTDAEARGPGIFFALFRGDEGAIDPAAWLQPR